MRRKQLRSSRALQRALTILELTVVIAVAMILAAIIATVFLNARPKAQSTASSNQLRQIFQALAVYETDHDTLAPPHVTFQDNGVPNQAPLDRIRKNHGAALWAQSLANYGVTQDILHAPGDPYRQEEPPFDTQTVRRITSYSHDLLLIRYKVGDIFRLSTSLVENPSSTGYMVGPEAGYVQSPDGLTRALTLKGQPLPVLYFDGSVKPSKNVVQQ